MERFKALFRNEKGSVVMLVSLAMVGLLAITGVVVDLGNLFVTKAHLKKTANAAVLSAAQELVATKTAVENIIDDVLLAHSETDSLVDNIINLGSSVSVNLKKEVPLTFSKLLGQAKVNVEAKSTAQIVNIGRARGVAPLGIDESIPLEYNVPYKLKVDQKEVDSGNFGILALSGPGAKIYEENLRNGFSGEIEVGDIIDTQTGNIAGKTRSAIAERIQNCDRPGDLNHRDCSRILLVPVYRPHNHTSNQLKQVKIVGFAYFYILDPMSSKDTSISGIFIKRVDSGHSDPHAVNRGAYSIKLVE